MYVICLCLRIVVSITYCVVFLFVFACFVYHMLPDCPFLIAPSVFSNVCLLKIFGCSKTKQDNHNPLRSPMSERGGP